MIPKFTPEQHKEFAVKSKAARIKLQETYEEWVQILPSKVKSYYTGIPTSFRKLFYDLKQGKSSTLKAIKAKCVDCANFDRDKIKDCYVETCPLHSYRPYKRK